MGCSWAAASGIQREGAYCVATCTAFFDWTGFLIIAFVDYWFAVRGIMGTNIQYLIYYHFCTISEIYMHCKVRKVLVFTILLRYRFLWKISSLSILSLLLPPSCLVVVWHSGTSLARLSGKLAVKMSVVDCCCWTCHILNSIFTCQLYNLYSFQFRWHFIQF